MISPRMPIRNLEVAMRRAMLLIVGVLLLSAGCNRSPTSPNPQPNPGPKPVPPVSGMVVPVVAAPGVVTPGR